MQEPSTSRAEGVVSLRSVHAAADTLSRLRDSVRAKGLTEFALIDHSGAAAQAGLTMREAKVLIFGSPAAGTPLMVAAPLVALDLPLKILVWEDGDGQCWVSYTDPAYLARRYGLPETLSANIAGVAALAKAAASA